ncbi:hypothetical protein [Sphingomonas dokdonensis]|uniref:Uncharacterized protein n=1 Tax=Sphingomonas dokdonensis TaxID=344880 RepID=A0A245ZNN6_9SPHN|nr:hypothetical protein [Sphingomonas dokdonensis]OWK31347.1 hypothetical protein SPDO_13560 [Sphingomonas dokdonensis]
MPIRAFPILPLLLAAPLMISASEPAVRFAQMSYRERIVIRIPRLPSPRLSRAQPTIDWEEKKAPKCVPANVLASAVVSPQGDVDLVATDGRRLRAKLDDDCPSLNFYRGFYLKRSKDGMICAKRDALRTRSGGYCKIARFRTLIEKK